MERELSVPQKVVQYIQGRIMSGELHAGDKLPSERQVAEELNVSRPLVREGFTVLEYIGVVEKRKGSGTYIKRQVDTVAFEPLSLSFKLRGGNIHEIYSVRCAVEEYAVRDACKNAREEDVQRLWAIQADMEAAESYPEKSRMDQQLHYEIVRISGSLLMLELLQRLSLLLDPLFRNYLETIPEPRGSLETIYKEHRDIIGAIEAKDEGLATRSMYNHLRQLF